MSDDVSGLVRQWLDKAENDWNAVNILSANSSSTSDIICFHCQQYAEKLLKAYLTCHNIETPKIHDLRRLILLCEPAVPELLLVMDSADRLSDHAVVSRYPDDFRPIGRDDAETMMRIAGEIAAILLPRIGGMIKPAA